jgi:hypothetical protein
LRWTLGKKSLDSFAGIEQISTVTRDAWTQASACPIGRRHGMSLAVAIARATVAEAELTKSGRRLAVDEVAIRSSVWLT